MLRSISLAAILAASLALPALAQNSTTKSPPAAAVEAVAPLKLTEAQAKSWMDKEVYSSDGKKLGEIAAFARGTDGTVTEMHIDIGGFLGMGETHAYRLNSGGFAGIRRSNRELAHDVQARRSLA